LGYVEYVVPGAVPGDPNPLPSRGRLRGALRNAFGGRAAEGPNIGDALFRRLDADGDGSVTREEVRTGFPDNPAASTTIFDRLDSDGSESLSLPELRRLSGLMGR
jgi:hypothetical protein